MFASCTGRPKVHINTVNTAILNLSTAYIIGGNKDAGAQVLSKITDFSNNYIGAAQAFTYHNNYFTYYIHSSDTLNAANALTQMEQALQNPKLKNEDKLNFFNLYTEKQCLLKMVYGEYDGAEQIFDLSYQRGQSTLAKVSAKYILGIILLRYGRTEDAKGAFEYVAEHGGTTYYKKKAVKQLETWGKPAPGQAEGVQSSAPVSTLNTMPMNTSCPPPPNNLNQMPINTIYPPPPNETPFAETTTHQTHTAINNVPGKNSVFNMTLHQRKQYNLVIFVMFAVLFVLFGALSMSLHTAGFGPFSDTHPLFGAVLNILSFGLLAGWGFTGLVGGIWLGSRYIMRQGKGLIVLACVLFMLTIQIFWLVGLALTLPFAIYNIWFMRRNKGVEIPGQDPIFQQYNIAHKKSPLSKALSVALYVALCVVLLVIAFAMIDNSDAQPGNQFFPTMEEAFAHAADRDSSGEFGEIFFIDEHENTISVFSIRDDRFLVSHFRTEMRYGERWYSQRFGNFLFHHLGAEPEIARIFLHNQISEDGFHSSFSRRSRENFGRGPIYGTYRHELVRYLSINGTPVDYVFEHTDQRGEQIFLWYIADIPMFTGSRDDIVISFDPP